jgi:hypothetical protein
MSLSIKNILSLPLMSQLAMMKGCPYYSNFLTPPTPPLDVQVRLERMSLLLSKFLSPPLMSR